MGETGTEPGAFPGEIFADIAAEAPFGVYIVQDGKIVYANRWLERFSGYRVSAEEPLDVLSVIHPDDRQMVAEQLRMRLAGGPAWRHYPARFVGRDGRVREVELHPHVSRRLGRPAIWGTLVDISARIESERLLAEHSEAIEAVNRELRAEIEQRRGSEARLRLFAAAIEASSEGVYLIGLDGTILYANPAAAQMSRRPREEIVGLPVAELHRDSDIPTGVIMPALLRDGSWSGEVQGRGEGKDDVVFWLTASLVRDEAGKPTAMFGLLHDETAQRQLEQVRIRDQKLESIGVLAGGLAHDFNNLLTIVMGNLELIRLATGDDGEVAEALDHATEAATRAGDLTRQLITFSKGGQPVKRVAELSRPLRDAVLFAASGSAVACDFDFPGGLPAVEFDEAQLRQVVLNIVQNAREAMPAGGTLQVAARVVDVGDGEVPFLAGGSHVRVNFTDHGDGIAAENLARVFDPYFSTKELGTAKGRGLGLAVCYSIIRNHGGAIVANSRPGVGTTFSMFLPVRAAATGEEVEEPVAPGDAACLPPTEVQAAGPSRGRLLVMDDEPLMLEMAGAFCRQLGFDATLCSNGSEAVVRFQIAADSGRPYLAAILDLTVPGGMGGIETLERLRAIDPRVPVVLSSGYPDDAGAADRVVSGAASFIAKPYSLQGLGALLGGIAGSTAPISPRPRPS